MYNSVTMPKSGIEDFKQSRLMSRKVGDKKPAGESKAVPNLILNEPVYICARA